MSDATQGADRNRVRGNAVPVPPFWRERVVMLCVALSACVALHLLVLLSPASWWARLGLSPFWRFSVWAVYPVWLVWFIRTGTAGDPGTRRRLAAGELPCWQCGYDLSRQDPHGRCPECGTSYEPGTLRERWGEVFRRKRGPTPEGSGAASNKTGSTPTEPSNA
jgi:hypothetical protein